MIKQRLIAAVMLISSAALAGYVLQDIAYPAILCLLGLLGLRRKIILAIKPERRVMSLLMLLCLLILFSIHYRFFVIPAAGRFGPSATMAWQTVTRYFLAAMVLMLFLGTRRCLPISIALFHIATMISAGQVFLAEDWIGLYRSLELFSVVLLLLFLLWSTESPSLSSQQIRSSAGPFPHQAAWAGQTSWILPTLLLTLILNVGWIWGSMLYSHQYMINVISNFWRNTARLVPMDSVNPSVGFSSSGKLSRLGQIKQSQDQGAVLRIISDKRPGYLRAWTFDSYRRGEWIERSIKERILPDKTRFDLSMGGRTSVYELQKNMPEPPYVMTIEHMSYLGSTLFTESNTSTLSIPADSLWYTDNHVPYLERARSDVVYEIGYHYSPLRIAPGRIHQERLKDLPRRLSPAISNLADELFEGCTTTQEKIEAVVDHFRLKYTYSLQVDVPPGRDPITHFLLNEESGYCEYFASATALLLRCGNVPTRYVTGFRVTERDPFNQRIWIARNQDAHAWVEAWDAEKGSWQLVESTVQEALAADMADDFAAMENPRDIAYYRKLLHALYQYGILGVVVWLYEYHNLYMQFLISVMIALMVILLGRKLGYRLRVSRIDRHKRPQQWHRLHSLRRKLDRKLRRLPVRCTQTGRHLERASSETLERFTDRLQTELAAVETTPAIIDWYRDYNRARFGKHLPQTEVTRLSHRLKGLLSHL